MEQLPADFIERTRTLLGSEEYTRLENALCLEPPVSIRVNEEKGFGKVQDATGKVAWCDTGYYLKTRPAFTFDPLFHAGAYYVQEASSMFLEKVLRQYVNQPVTALDLCAAPGGKSTLIRSLLPKGSLLVCNEVIRSRSHILAENMIKWGHPGVVVTHNDPADFSGLDALFDIVFTDVPCSGEGMFRKDKEAMQEWSIDNVNICRQRQRRIIDDIWNCLKPGGILVYSTCTYNTEENEENINWIKEQYGAEVLTVDITGIGEVTGNLSGCNFSVYRFFPHKTHGEGFFLAALRKPGEYMPGYNKAGKTRQNKKQGGKPVVIPSECKQWLLRPEEYCFEIAGNGISAIPLPYSDHISLLRQQLRIVHAGISIAEQKGKDLIPNHSLAMSVCHNKDCFESMTVDYEQAIAYLRKEVIIPPSSSPRGHLLVTFKNTPLGFVKNIGNRANNLYPQEWRIRSGYNAVQPIEVVTR